MDVFWSDHIPMVKALEKLGCKVTSFNCRTIARENALFKKLRKAPKSKNRLGVPSNILKSQVLNEENMTIYRSYGDMKKPNIIRRILKPISKFSVWYGRKKMNRLLINQVKNNNYDLIFFANTKIIDYKIVSKINKYCKTFYFFFDPIGIAISLKIARFAKNCTWTASSCSDVNKYFIENCANSIFFQYGVDQEIYYPKKEEKEIDVFFIGGKNKKREEFIDYLLKNKINVQSFGYGWKNGPLFTNDVADKYRKSKIILNFVREGTGFSIRVFQAMGTGSFLLSECCPDLKRIFQLKKHLECFNTREELLKLILHYFENSEEREKIAENGCKFVHKNYSMEVIMKKILNTIKE